MKTNFTKLLLKASQPLKTSPLETKLRDGCLVVGEVFFKVFNGVSHA